MNNQVIINSLQPIIKPFIVSLYKTSKESNATTAKIAQAIVKSLEGILANSYTQVTQSNTEPVEREDIVNRLSGLLKSGTLNPADTVKLASEINKMQDNYLQKETEQDIKITVVDYSKADIPNRGTPLLKG